MKWIVPADACSDHSEWFIVNCVGLVAHQHVSRSTGWCQGVLSMLDSPLELLCGDQYLTKASIDLGLSAV